MNRDIESAAKTVLTIAPTLVTLMSMEQVALMAKSASERGYLKPDEDDAIREVFSRYLRSRAALIQTIEDLRPLAAKEIRKTNPDQPEIFIVAYAAATLLMRAGFLLIDTFRKDDLVVKKLDEAEPRFGIPRKQFTRVYRSSTSPLNVWGFLEASRYWKENSADFEKRFLSDPLIKPMMDLIAEEEPQTEISKRFYATSRLKYRLHSFLRRHHSGFKNVTFVLFKISGRMISEVQLQWIRKRKRVTPAVQRKLAKLLKPGDIFVTRHDDAATNLFLPGFWPHAALYIGTEQQRRELGIELREDQAARSADPICVLEARKDGVLFRELSDTLSVDACTVLRPRLNQDQLRESLTRAISHEGKEYDFEFDFRRSDKLVCTEVVYRAYHHCGPIEFELASRAGRVCLSAEDLLDHAVDDSFFDVMAIYGFKGNRFATGQRAKALLEQSYRK